MATTVIRTPILMPMDVDTFKGSGRLSYSNMTTTVQTLPLSLETLVPTFIPNPIAGDAQASLHLWCACIVTLCFVLHNSVNGIQAQAPLTRPRHSHHHMLARKLVHNYTAGDPQAESASTKHLPEPLRTSTP